MNNTIREFPPLRTPVLNRVPHMAEPEYVAPVWLVVSVRCLRSFRWRAVKYLRNGTVEPLGEAYSTQIGEVLDDVIEPEAKSLVALHWAEIV